MHSPYVIIIILFEDGKMYMKIVDKKTKAPRKTELFTGIMIGCIVCCVGFFLSLWIGCMVIYREMSFLQFSATVFAICLFFFIMLICFLQFWIKERVVNPLKRLQNQAADFVKISKEKSMSSMPAIEPLKMPANDEIQQLSDSFYLMAKDIKSYVHDIVEVERDKQASEASNAAKASFFFNLSHDIRTPLNAIVGFTGMAKDNVNDSEKVAECLDNIQMSSDLLVALINDILEMSRIESGKTLVASNEEDIDNFFNTVKPAFTKLANDKDIDISFEICNIRNRYVYADTVRVQRIMMNLISNAIKYTPEKGRVKVKLSQLPGGGENGGLYQISVEDNGYGMSYEFQKHVFDPFTREDKEENKDIQGTGLGLSLTKAIVELLGGSIMCQSIPVEGTLFTVKLPFKIRNPENSKENFKRDFSPIPEDYFLGKRVLLVDDNKVNRTIAIYLLKNKGFKVDEAENGQVAVNKINEMGPDYYDVVLMDVLMPVMDGYEATETIKEQYPELRAPIIALSANAFDEDRRRSLEVGMDDHIGKPIVTEELFASLRKFVK